MTTSDNLKSAQELTASKRALDRATGDLLSHARQNLPAEKFQDLIHEVRDRQNFPIIAVK
jgi:hypothetical protein